VLVPSQDKGNTWHGNLPIFCAALQRLPSAKEDILQVIIQNLLEMLLFHIPDIFHSVARAGMPASAQGLLAFRKKRNNVIPGSKSGYLTQGALTGCKD